MIANTLQKVNKVKRKTSSPTIQTKLTIGASNDKYEREADAMANHIMRMPQSFSSQPLSNGLNGIQRKCTNCEKDEEHIQRKPLMMKTEGGTPIATQALGSQLNNTKGSGSPLSSGTNSFMSNAFGTDFSNVRIHTGGSAVQMNQGLNARAFTHGSDIYFNKGEYQPGSFEGKRLLGHELTHVVQQGHSNLNIINRADLDAVDRIMAIGNTPRSGIQFFPTNVTDTRVGPVSIGGGLLNASANRLNVIIAQNLTPRQMARLILPLWTTATPFSAPGAVAPVPLDIIDEEILAKGLMVYNSQYLGLPDMTKWRAGLRFPLPVLIDEKSEVATLNPTIIRSLSTGFIPAWLPLLDHSAVSTVPAATLNADVTSFLSSHQSNLARGLHLGARAITNAIASLPFIQEVFRQVGAAGFDLALQFMDGMVNRQISLLASQRDGAAILVEIRNALLAAPATLNSDQQSSLTRAGVMLNLVTGLTAQAPPAALRNQAEKTIVVDTVKLDGSTHNPATQIAIANAIYLQCNVRIDHGINATATSAETTSWLNGDRDLADSSTCGSISNEERNLYNGATANYGLSAPIRAFFVSNTNAAGYSIPRYCGTGPAQPYRGFAAIDNEGSTDTLAHEIGHILINHGDHPGSSIMSERPRPVVTLTNWQCNRIYNNV